MSRARPTLVRLGLGTLLILLACTFLVSPRGDGSAASVSGPSDVTLLALRADLTRGEYAPSVQSGVLEAPNRAHDVRVRFLDRGLELVPRDGSDAWRLSWRTSRWGRGADLRPVEARRSPQAEGSRVAYASGSLTEWYDNRPEGLEQGFDLATRPAGQGEVRIEGTFEGSLRPRRSGPAGGVELVDEHETPVLRYGELRVEDAGGREVPARMELEGNRLAIVVDDRDAEYPLVVDPLYTAALWMASGDQADCDFALSVATAGDVNGDGCSDVIVGARDYDSGQSNEGKVFAYYGSADGPASAPSWTAECDQAGADFGYCVAPAGDVNGDGFDDVIIGAYNFDNGQSNEGRAFVYLGSASGLQSTPVWTAESDQASANFGTAVGTAGDVNGDGRADVIVGAPYYDGGMTDEGRAYVFLGTAGGVSPTPVRTLEPDVAGVHFGTAVSTAGDANGDGYADILVGASFYPNGSLLNCGAAFAYHGGPAGPSASPSWSVIGDQGQAFFGTAVAFAGDVNGDGYADVIIGANAYDGSQTDEGRAFVYHGSAAGLGATAAWSAGPGVLSAYFGAAVATAGDVDGDGFADVIVGAYRYADGQTGEGAAFLYRGSPSGLSSTFDWMKEGDQVSAAYGRSVGTAGDVDGDGFSDVIVGANGYDDDQVDEGRAWVYRGVPEMPLSAEEGAWYTPGLAGSELGWCVASAGDVNGDGFTDAIFGAPGGSGRVQMHLGSAFGLESAPAWSINGASDSTGLGRSVASAGDVDGDGYDDVIVGESLYDGDLTDEGRALLYRGSAMGLESTPSWVVEGNDYDARFGLEVAPAGDVNGDGYADVIVGAHWSGWGRAYVFHGSPSGLDSIPAWIGQGQTSTDRYGASVAGAGDVNSDGFSDIIIGSPDWDDGDPNHLEYGRVLVYRGSAGGIESTAWTTYEGPESYAHMGALVGCAGNVDGYESPDYYYLADGTLNRPCRVYIRGYGLFLEGPGGRFTSLAGVGDLNGDGYSDFAIGRGRYNAGLPFYDGIVYVHAGGAAGLDSTVYWSTVGGTDYAYIANDPRSLSAAGDVNGDGLSDFLVGASAFDGSAGRVFLYSPNPGGGRVVLPRQLRTLSDAPIATLGRSDSETAFRVAMIGRSAAGRSRVRLEIEARPLGVPFGGAGRTTGPMVLTGTPGPDGSSAPLLLTVGGLTASTHYRWRARVVANTPYFPPRWVSPPGNSVTEADVRTDGPVTVSTYTPTGAPVVVPLGANVTLYFNQVTGAGYTTLVLEETGPEVPTGFQPVPVSPPTYYDISTTATFTDVVTVCVHYRQEDVIGNEADMKLFHWSEATQGWIDVTYSVSVAENLVCGRTDSLSPFLLAVPMPGVSVPELGAVPFALSPPSPNPFRETTTIAFGLPAAGPARIRILDVAGRLVRDLSIASCEAGRHRITWDGRDESRRLVASGIYFVRLEAAGRTETRRVARLH